MSITPAPAEITFERIVCGIDLSPQSRVAVGQAFRLAEEDAGVLGVSVLDTGELTFAGIHVAEIAEEMQTKAMAALQRARNEFPALQTSLLRGSPVAALLHRVQEERADLVAVAAHGSSRAAGIVFGSVATAMAHHAPGSVLVARESEDFPKMILHATDGSPASLEAGGVVARLAARHGATVVVLQVSDEVGQESLIAEEAVAIFEACGVEPIIRVAEGSPQRRIVETAHEVEASLVVVGSRGRTGVKALGSVSERVAHRAPCSVLIVRRPMHAEPAE